jgi:NitT/TauT family transport system ATP-binding protein
VVTIGPDLTAGARAVAGGLVIEHLSKRFGPSDESVHALGDVSIRVERGRFVAIVGPSGSGKSTLLRIVAGLASADAGSVTIFGESVEDARENKHIGYVPQTPALLPWRTVAENVALPFEVNRAHGPKDSDTSATKASRIEEMLQAVGLSGQGRRFPADLSGGMQQRVAIARALIFRPSVLLMDEPFSALDELTREQLRFELLRLFDDQRQTVLFVTHSIAEAVHLADVVVVLSSSPGRTIGEVVVPLARPREELIETTMAFHDVENEVRAVMRAGWTR